MNQLLYKVVKNLKPKDWYLDLGCGDNIDVLEMRKLNFNAVGIDKDNSLADIKEDLLNLKLENNKYSCISSFYVLHFLEKKESLKILYKVKKELKQGGYVVLELFNKKDMPPKSNRGYFDSDELLKIFENWQIIYLGDVLVFDKAHLGYEFPHYHNMTQFIAKK